MKKVLTIILCLIFTFSAVGCSDFIDDYTVDDTETTIENESDFDFKEDLLPDEASIPELEEYGYTLSPVDGEKVIYRYYSASEGINDLFIRYSKPITWTDGTAFIDINIKLLDPYVRDQTEYKEGLMNGATGTAERVQNWGDEAIEAVFNTESLNVSSKKRVAVVEDGKTTGDSFYIVDGIMFGYDDNYTFRIEYHNIDIEDYSVVTVETFKFLKQYMDSYDAYVKGE